MGGRHEILGWLQPPVAECPDHRRDADQLWAVVLRAETLPVGTTYAVWTGIGAAGTALMGMLLFGESRDAARLMCIGLIIAGILGLRLVEQP